MAAELLLLIDQEIPEGRQSLQDSYANLEKVAQYCESNYIQASDKRKALDETRNYTTHSLASVAYQINSLATNFLKLLDRQQTHVADMEASVNHLSQVVNIHKEKVARREIGVLTTNKTTTRPPGCKNGIIFPEANERPIKYVRKGIDYTCLDDIGHGIKSQQSMPRNSRTSSVSSTASQPSTHPPTPPQQQGRGTTRPSQTSNVSQYQTAQYARSPAPPVAPPSVPAHQPPPPPSNYGAPMQLRPGYLPSASQFPMGQVPTIGIARPVFQTPGGPPPSPSSVVAGGQKSRLSQQSVTTDALPPPLPVADPPEDYPYEEDLPPPPLLINRPLSNMISDRGRAVNARPEPSYPLYAENDEGDEDPYAATGPELLEPNWIPNIYIEKVVAIYDYSADKDDELSFSENALIYVIKKNEDGWWEGVFDGVTGLFPGNYVEPCM